MAEGALSEMTFGTLLDAVAAKSPTPGGGAVASAVGALAAALAGMVVSYSVGKKSLAMHEPLLKEAQAELTRARAILLRLADEDAAAYGLVNELQRLPESDARRREQLPAALEASVQPPLATIATSVTLLRLFERLATTTNRQLRSDLAIAAVLAEATARASWWNVAVNAGFLPDSARAKAVLEESDRSIRDARAIAARVEGACA
jgi:formiminotetrahydrofolate cyclodeaminase